ncbi:MAG TPA: FRG domain-containing protein [Bryobacteraceae bacterium]|nr:FRG domain-containing protein [Bryobacteraceae bacterium]
MRRLLHRSENALPLGPPPVQRVQDLDLSTCVPFVEDHRIDTWEDFKSWVGSFETVDDWVFRGQAHAAWELSPSLDRACPARYAIGPDEYEYTVDSDEDERELLYQFKRRAHHDYPDVPKDDDFIGWLALLQHYGAPTRLLDWSESAYVGLYFAVEKEVPEDGCAVWAINRKWLQRRSDERTAAATGEKIPIGHEADRDTRLNTILNHQKRPPVVIVVNPMRLNERMAAQRGLFLLNLRRPQSFESGLAYTLLSPEAPKRIVVRKLTINPSARWSILRGLDRLNINAATLYPGIDGFARSLGSRLSYKREFSWE